MDHCSHQSLNLQEAKANLRSAAKRASPAAWVQRNPWKLLSLAVVTGFLSARFTNSTSIVSKLACQVAPLLMSDILRPSTRQKSNRKETSNN
jgi:hypothetical protein